MKTSTRRLVAAGALLVATLCALPTDARKAGGQTRKQAVNLRLEQLPMSAEATLRDGKIVGMTAVKKDGSQLSLQPTKPTCDTGCPAGKTMSCFTDHDAGMSICTCVGSGGGGGGGGAVTIDLLLFAPLP